MPCASAKAKLAALGDEPTGCGHVLVPDAFVLEPEAFRGAIDHHRRLLQSLDVYRWVACRVFEIGHFLFFDSELGPLTHEAEDFHTVIEQRPILVEGDLVDLQIVLQMKQQANDWLTKRSSADDMYHVLRPSSSLPAVQGIVPAVRVSCRRRPDPDHEMKSDAGPIIGLKGIIALLTVCDNVFV